MIGAPEEIKEILNISGEDVMILKATNKIAKTISKISRITKIPRTSLLYKLKNLEQRHLIVQIQNNKFVRWKSNVKKVAHRLKNFNL